MEKKNFYKISTILLIAILSISIPTLISSTKVAAAPLDPTLIPKYVTPLLAYIPVYTPTNILAGNGSIIEQDYYVNVTQFTEQILPAGFPTTTVWGYGGVTHDPITGANLGYVRNAPGPTFNVTRGTPTKITWVNNLTDPISGALLNYLYPVDPTLHWANPNNISMNDVMAQSMMGLAPPYDTGYNGSAILSNGVYTNPDQWNAQSPAPIVTHVHGAEVQSSYDGDPEEWYTANGLHGADYSTYQPTDSNAAVYYYPNQQEPATIWYHDHALGLTRINVYSGLAGYYIISDPNDATASSLPTTFGSYDIPLAIQDRSFYDNGSLRFDNDPAPNPSMHPYWVPEFFGDTFMVNGNTYPYLNVNQTVYRFRILDGCNARFLNITLVDLDNNNATIPFTVFARDQGYLNSSAIDTSQLLGPGMRSEILVNFTGITAGHRILMMNDANAPFPSGNPVIPGLTDQIMEFIVQGPDATPQSNLPSTLNPTLTGSTWPTLPTATRQRLLTLTEVQGAGGPLEVLLDGQKWVSPTTELPIQGTTEIWEIANPTADAHPMHWHLAQFQLVSRQPFDDAGWLTNWTAVNGPAPLSHTTISPGNITDFYNGTPTGPQPDETGWLDTVTMYPGQVTTIIIRFAQQDGSPYVFDPTQGPGYVWHCHIIDHEDNEMMRRMDIISTSQLSPLYDVVRGQNNAVYWRTYTFGNSSWSNYNAVPLSATFDKPAAAVYGGQLYIAVRGTDNQSIWFGSVNLADKSFSGWTQISGSTPSAPTLVSYDTKLMLVIRGFNDIVFYRTYDTTTSLWTGWVGVPDGATSDTPAAAVIGTTLSLVVKGFSTTNTAINNTLYHGILNLNDNSFSGWTTIAGSTPSAPTLVAEQATNALQLIVRGDNNIIYIDRWNGMNWQGWSLVQSGSTSTSPTMTILNNDQYFEVVGTNNVVYTSTLNTVNGVFSGWTAANGSTNSPSTLTH
jgi:FtsP/CotA-like multicopper oxidase with cupredoxin domain